MAKYRITLACGHTVEKELFGDKAEKDKEIDWLESYGVCDDCCRKHQDAQADQKGEGS